MYVISDLPQPLGTAMPPSTREDALPTPIVANIKMLSQFAQSLKIYQQSLTLLEQLDDMRHGRVITAIPKRTSAAHATPLSAIQRSVASLEGTHFLNVSPLSHLEQLIFIVYLNQKGRRDLFPKALRASMQIKGCSHWIARNVVVWMAILWIALLFHAHLFSSSSHTQLREEMLTFSKQLTFFAPYMDEDIDIEDAIQWVVAQHMLVSMQERRQRKPKAQQEAASNGTTVFSSHETLV